MTVYRRSGDLPKDRVERPQTKRTAETRTLPARCSTRGCSLYGVALKVPEGTTDCVACGKPFDDLSSLFFGGLNPFGGAR